MGSGKWWRQPTGESYNTILGAVAGAVGKRNAGEIEAFVVQLLKAYLLATDFEAEAQRTADQVNGSTPDLRAERAELTSVNAQINNGLKTILTGMDIPELRDEMDRLRVRKSELEDIIGRRTARRRPVDPKNIVRIFEESLG